MRTFSIFTIFLSIAFVSGDICSQLRRQCEVCVSRLDTGDPDAIVWLMSELCAPEMNGLRVQRCQAMEYHCRNIMSCTDYSCDNLARFVRNN